MTELTTQQIDQFRDRLAALRAEIEGLLGATAEDARPVDLSLPIGRLSRADAMQMQDMAQMNRRQLEIRLKQTEVALTAVGNGTYGSCRSCQQPIGLARLEARPETPFCIDCQESFEQGS
jgi:DnaK suppressor protein